MSKKDPSLFGLSAEELRQLGFKVGGGGPAGPAPDAGAASRDRRRGARSREPALRDPALRFRLLAIAVLGMVAWGSSARRMLPDPVAAGGPAEAFSSARAMAGLVGLSEEAHPVGAPEHTRVRAHLVRRLTELGLEPEVVPATAYRRDFSRVVSATVHNVVATLPGTDPTGAVAVLAAYDAPPGSPAAGATGFGVATVLETVRALTAGAPLRNDVVVAFTDADEVGRLGTSALARDPAIAQARVALSVDAVRSGGPSVAIPKGPAGLDALALGLGRGASEQYVAPSLVRALRPAGVDSTGLGPLAAGGAQGLTFVTLGTGGMHGLPLDTPERVRESELQQAGNRLLGAVRLAGGLDLGAAADAASSPGEEAVRFALPVVGAVGYPPLAVPLVTLGLFVMALLAGLALRRRRGTRRGVLIGIATGVAAIAASGALAEALLALQGGAHVEHGFVTGAFYRDGLPILATCAVAFACVAAAHALARRWERRDDLVLGALLPPLVVALWLTFAVPGAAHVLQWPVAIALVGAQLSTLLGSSGRAGIAARILLVVLASGVVLLAVPNLELLAGAWTFREAGRLGWVFALFFLTLLPLLARLQDDRGWWAPTFGVGIAAALVTGSLPGLQGAAEHPTPTSLLYLADQPVRSRLPAGVPAAEVAETDGVRRMEGQWLTLAGREERWARSWVAEPPAGSRDPGLLLLSGERRFEIAGGGPESELAEPSARVVGWTDDEGSAALSVAVRPGLGAELLGLYLPPGVDGRLVGVGGVFWEDGPVAVRSVEHWGLPESGELTVELSLDPAADTLRLGVVEHHLRPRELLGDFFFARADSLVANTAVGGDRAIQRTVLRVPLTGTADGGADPSGRPGTVADR